ncbi:MAG: class I SAM-dependent methyltransferase [Parachlamydiaceae bacterium]|nr:class I SAM-dependent methyltransferase [Parachlamydiaceae bacterium]
MAQNRLNIIQVDQNSSFSKKNPIGSSRSAQKKESQARFERLWLLDPEQFNPLRNCMQRERLDRTWNLLVAHINLKNKNFADIGCAAGVFSRRIRDAGAKVDAVDIAENALKHLKENDCNNITPRHDAMPNTSLPDSSYDCVVCTEVIAELSHQDFRLFFAELARLIKADGYVVCSTPIDINTEGGLQRFIELAHTEFDIIKAIPSYHALYLRIKKMVGVPDLYIRSSKDPILRHKEMGERNKIRRWWFWLNSTVVIAPFWKLINFAISPIKSLIKNSTSTLLSLEKICQFFWDEAGISHVIIICQRRPLHVPEPTEMPIERLKKRQVWE